MLDRHQRQPLLEQLYDSEDVLADEVFTPNRGFRDYSSTSVTTASDDALLKNQL
jgi:hypothetical protein